MWNRSGIVGQFFRPALSAAALIAVAGAAYAQTASTPATAKVDVTIKVTDLRSAKGVVRACMTTDEGKFPKCRGVAGAHSTVVAAGDVTTLKFSGVKPGKYAVALLHDENDNGKADRALGMMPTEGFGFSRDAKVRMGPPNFDDASFDVGSASVRQTIRMRYML